MIKKIFNKLKINIVKSPSPKLHLFGFQIGLGVTPRNTSDLSYVEIISLLEREHNHKCNLLDVGIGDGRLLSEIRKLRNGPAINYEGLDLGNSNDFKKFDSDIVCYNTDLLNFTTDKTYDYVVASHFMEHQNNISGTCFALWNLVKLGGYLILEFPLPHRKLFGGHVALLTPALLAYNFAKIGADVTSSLAKTKGNYAILVLQKKSNINKLEHLIWDTGEVDQLKYFLPSCIYEDCDLFISWNTLKY